MAPAPLALQAPAVPQAFVLERLGPVAGGADQLVRCNERVLQLGPAALLVLEGLGAGLDEAALLTRLNRSGLLPRPARADELQALLAQLQAAGSRRSGLGDRLASVWMRCELLQPSRWPRCLALFGRLLPSPAAVRWLLPLLLLINGALAWSLAGQPLLLTPLAPLYLAAGMFLLVFAHEWGHAAASWRLGIRPAGIGVGLFMLFPVLYTDVTAIWRLPARERMLVNLAGSHVQLLLGLPLAALAQGLGGTAVGAYLHLLVLANLLSCVFNLIPFTRLDGYWVLSDALGIERLHERAQQQLGVELRRLAAALRRRPPPVVAPAPTTLRVYAIAQALFFGALIAYGVFGLVRLGRAAWAAPDAQAFGAQLLAQPLRSALLLLFLLMLLRPLLRLLLSWCLRRLKPLQPATPS